jgi:hypothetical protein
VEALTLAFTFADNIKLHVGLLALGSGELTGVGVGGELTVVVRDTDWFVVGEAYFGAFFGE